MYIERILRESKADKTGSVGSAATLSKIKFS